MDDFRRQMLYLRMGIIVLVIVGSLVVRVWEGWRRTHEERGEQERAEMQAMRERVTGGMVRAMPEVFGRFALWYGAESDPGRLLWMVVSPEGRMEKSMESPQEVLAYFQSLPVERRAEGMFVTMDLTHLAEPERTRGTLHPHMIKLFEDAGARTAGAGAGGGVRESGDRAVDEHGHRPRRRAGEVSAVDAVSGGRRSGGSLR